MPRNQPVGAPAGAQSQPGMPAPQPGMPAPKPKQPPQPLVAQPPQALGLAPASEQVITSNLPFDPNALRRGSADQNSHELEAYIQAHREFLQHTGQRYGSFPAERPLRIGDTEIPVEILRNIGEWSIFTKPMPEYFLKPGQTWESARG